MDAKQAINDINKQFESFAKLYNVLGDLLTGFNIDPAIKAKARFDIDTGFLWIKEACNGQLVQLQKALEQEVVTDKPVEENNEQAA
jgi:hypothetical protein